MTAITMACNFLGGYTGEIRTRGLRGRTAERALEYPGGEKRRRLHGSLLQSEFKLPCVLPAGLHAGGSAEEAEEIRERGIKYGLSDTEKVKLQKLLQMHPALPGEIDPFFGQPGVYHR